MWCRVQKATCIEHVLYFAILDLTVACHCTDHYIKLTVLSQSEVGDIDVVPPQCPAPNLIAFLFNMGDFCFLPGLALIHGYLNPVGVRTSFAIANSISFDNNRWLSRVYFYLLVCFEVGDACIAHNSVDGGVVLWVYLRPVFFFNPLVVPPLHIVSCLLV